MSEWAINTRYRIGQVVHYKTYSYTCKQSHTSNKVWTPDSYKSLWSPTSVEAETKTLTKCDFCETCSKPNIQVPCNKRSAVPIPVPPKPPPLPIPVTTSLASWVTQDLWDTIFPYADCSAVYSPKDGKPIYTREGFIKAVDWMNSHKNAAFHGFGTSNDANTNKLEIAAFFANGQQETGDPSLTAPFPWLYPKADSQTGPQVGPAGGLVAVIEGIAPQIIVHDKSQPSPIKGVLSVTLRNMRPRCKQVLGLRDNDVMSCVVTSVKNGYMPNFGLGSGTGSGVVFQPGLVGVSDDGTLYGDESKSPTDIVIPTSKLVLSTTDRKYACLGTYCSFSGKNLTQLSYNYNYTLCSIDLFGDYRLARFPNLLVTMDRETWNLLPETFGFPGSIEGGKNKLPAIIANTTPTADVMGWLSTLWFWMTLRSGRPISCHQSMIEPKKYGITAVNLIVNNQSGLEAGSWAADKVRFYKRICNIMEISWENTIVSPPGIK